VDIHSRKRQKGKSPLGKKTGSHRREDKKENCIGERQTVNLQRQKTERVFKEGSKRDK
jgi:chorismate-pyruvate lyase